MVMRTFSKIYGLAGVRLGYAVAVPEVLAPLNRVKEPFAVNSLAQAAGVAALEDRAFVQRTVEMTRRERRYLYETFQEMDLEPIPSQANFILVRVGPDAARYQEDLLKRGVIVRPCGGYDLPSFLRVTVGDREQNERLIRALREVVGR
jgi:histidinol-phosphate aminotransferase